MSGSSVLNLAIAKPGFYSAVGSYSGCDQTSDPIGQQFVKAVVETYGGGNVLNMWGPLDGPVWKQNDAYLNAEKLRGTPLYLSTGTGLPGFPNDTPLNPLTQDGRATLFPDQIIVGGGIEAGVNYCTSNMAKRLKDLNIPAVVNFQPVGTHSWLYWQDNLHESWADDRAVAGYLTHMPLARLNGISLNYQVKGSGDLVVMIMGTGSPGRVWELHQVPALVAAGYRVCTFDNRGIAPSDECASGMTVDDLVGDTAALIELLQTGSTDKRAYVVGTSMGSHVAQELALTRPDLVRKAIFLTGHTRLDEFQKTLSEGERALIDSKVTLPAKYAASVTAVMNLSPATLADSRKARDWLDIFEFTSTPPTAGVRAQQGMDENFDRTAAYAGITVPCLAVGFADDRMIPASSTAQLAKAIPGAKYVEIPDVGHFGYLERPEAINEAILTFLRS